MPAIVAPSAPPPCERSVVNRSPNGTARTVMVTSGLALEYSLAAASSSATVSGDQCVRYEILTASAQAEAGIAARLAASAYLRVQASFIILSPNKCSPEKRL